MTDSEVLNLFRESGALLEGHFKLSSGLHSDRYLQSALVLQHPDFAEQLGRALGARLAHLDPTVVLSPALGGIVIGQEVGRAMHIRAIFAERQEGKLVIRRGFRLAPSDRVVVIEDVITTGLSTRETCDTAETLGAQVMGAGRDHRSRHGSIPPAHSAAGARAHGCGRLPAGRLSAVREGPGCGQARQPCLEPSS